MANYVVRATLAVNGQDISDFKAFTEKARILSKSVHLMYKTGNAQLTQRFTGELDYVVPKDTAEFDWASIVGNGGTLVVEFDNGEQTRFGGVSVTEIGDAKADGENEMIRPISFMAETRNGATGA
jgi:hypothetical protein